jgi:hypothetical protein
MLGCPIIDLHGSFSQDYFFHKEGTANGGNRFLTVRAKPFQSPSAGWLGASQRKALSKPC